MHGYNHENFSELNEKQIKSQIKRTIINANRYTHNLVKPGEKAIKNILLLNNNHIDELERNILKGGEWVINIKSVRNVLRGENFVYAFPELSKNKTIVSKGEKINRITLKKEDLNRKALGDNINLLLSSSLAEVKRRGSLVNEIKLRGDYIKELRDFLNQNDKANFELEAVSLRNSKTAQPVIVELNINYSNSKESQ